MKIKDYINMLLIIVEFKIVRLVFGKVKENISI